MIENLTRRLSDDYLDLDLLDERARDVLGLLRADEIVIADEPVIALNRRALAPRPARGQVVTIAAIGAIV